MFRRSRIACLATLALALAITVLALAPLPGGLPVAGSDKSHHLIAFAALCLPIAALEPRWLPWALPAMAAFGGLIEIVQPWTGRTRDLADWQADLAGLGLGLLAGLALHRLLRRLWQG